jgi:N-acetylglucosamine-6-sulfatase
MKPAPDHRPRRWTTLLLSGLLCTALAVRTTAVEPPRPNILFVSSDDHRWDALGAAGNTAVHTPVLDRLAREGVYFTQATVNVSQCLPVRASLLTGRTTHGHGAYAHQNQRPEASRPTAFADWPTVPSLLRQAGYETVLVGKWHLASDPWRVGFSRTLTWLPGGAQRFTDPDLCQGESRELQKVKGFTQEIFADAAIDFLSHRGEAPKPFMLWLAFTAPHAPFAPNPERIEALYRGKTTAELLPEGFPANIPTNDWLHYYEGVSHFDEQLGRVLDTLERTGLAQSTVVVFLGDNGFMMGERGVGVTGGQGKVVPYEGSIRVPMMIRAPALQGFSGPSAAAVSSLDLAPTLLTLAGLETPISWPGRDLRPALRRATVEGFEAAFGEWVDNQSAPFGHLAGTSVDFRPRITVTH